MNRRKGFIDSSETEGDDVVIKAHEISWKLPLWAI